MPYPYTGKSRPGRQRAALPEDAFKIEMVVVAAGRVERRVASGTARVAREILRDGEFDAAGSAEDGGLAPFGLRPDFDGMAGESNVAILAGVVEAAALHLNGDNVGGPVVVEAAGLGIEVQAVDLWRF